MLLNNDVFYRASVLIELSKELFSYCNEVNCNFRGIGLNKVSTTSEIGSKDLLRYL